MNPMQPDKKGSTGGPPAEKDSRGRAQSSRGRAALPPLLDPFAKIDTHKNLLPHWQQGAATQFVTWRLGDSLPQEKLAALRHEKETWIRAHAEPWDEQTKKEYHRLFEDRVNDWLDAGEGSCLLKDTENRLIVEENLRHFDGQRYDLWAFILMPNHVHALFSLRPPHVLQKVLHSWKSYTAKQINHRNEVRGTLWQEDYWDRLIRSEHHYHRCVQYIVENPKKAGLSPSNYTLYLK